MISLESVVSVSCLSSPSGPPVRRRAGREPPAAIPYGSEVGDTGNEMFDLRGYGNGIELMTPSPRERRDWTGMVRVSRVGRAKPREVSVSQMEMC